MSVSIPDGLVILTFDDGVKSQKTFAAPILRECGFNATFYITEGLNFLTDKTRYLTWEEVRELRDLGFEIGNHTRQHKSVADQSPEELLSDIHHIDHQCNHSGIPLPTTFCYPGYIHTPEAVAALKKRGFTFARRGTAPEYPYHREGGRGPAYHPNQHDPLLVSNHRRVGAALELRGFRVVARPGPTGTRRGPHFPRNTRPRSPMGAYRTRIL